MPPAPDPRHLQGLLGTAAKRLAAAPLGRRVLEDVRAARSPKELRRILASVDLGLEPPAREMVEDAAGNPAQWEAIHATLLRAAELSQAERFQSGA